MRQKMDYIQPTDPPKVRVKIGLGLVGEEFLENENFKIQFSDGRKMSTGIASNDMRFYWERKSKTSFRIEKTKAK